MNSKVELLFTPFNIGSLQLKNRIIMAPMALRVAPVLQAPNQAMIDYLAARAKGGVGTIIMSATTFCRMDIVNTTTGTEFYQGVFERNISDYRNLINQLHSYGVKVGTQVSHRGPEGQGHIEGYEPVAPSAISRLPNSPPPRELSQAEIENLVNRFANSAILAREAGFDFIEIHMAHGYLISRFLSPASNKRQDRYGGSIENRARFAIEIVSGIREKVGPDYPISCRINGSDNISDGFTNNDCKQVAVMLAGAGVNLLDISGGIYGSSPLTVATCFSPRGCYVPFAEEIKRVVNIPVAVAGRINDPIIAEEVLVKGQADLIAMGRPFLADPDLPLKAMRGDYKAIRRCIACNTCIDRFWEGRDVCLVNPAMGKEAEFEVKVAPKIKKVLVIGGGLAGMEAAYIAAARGHRVTIYEAGDRLGGQWLLASVPPHKEEFASLIEYLIYQLTKTGVKVKLNKKASGQTIINEKPDAVIIATGAQPFIPRIAGLNQDSVCTAWDILNGRRLAGNKVLIVGGGSTGLETAELLLQKGKAVTVIEMLENVAGDMGATMRWSLLRELKRYGVDLHTSTKLIRIDRGEVVVKKGEKEQVLGNYDTIVMAVGTVSNNSFIDELKGLNIEVYTAGDAIKPRKAVDAIREGAEIANKI